MADLDRGLPPSASAAVSLGGEAGEAAATIAAGSAGLDGGDDGAGVRRPKSLGLVFWVAVTYLVVLVLAAIFAEVLPIKDPADTFSGHGQERPECRVLVRQRRCRPRTSSPG